MLISINILCLHFIFLSPNQNRRTLVTFVSSDKSGRSFSLISSLSRSKKNLWHSCFDRHDSSYFIFSSFLNQMKLCLHASPSIIFMLFFVGEACRERSRWHLHEVNYISTLSSYSRHYVASAALVLRSPWSSCKLNYKTAHDLRVKQDRGLEDWNKYCLNK